MTDARPIDGPATANLPVAVGALGVLLASLHLGSTVVALGPAALLDPVLAVGHAITAALVLALLAGCYALATGDPDPERYPRAAGWCVGGLAGILGMNLPLIGLYGFPSTAQNLQWAIWAATLGAAAGLAVGVVEARAIDRAVASERATVRADAAEAQRDWLDYMNGLLRHEVLNAANVIEGNADLLLDRHDDAETRDRLEAIRRNSRELSDVIQDVRGLLDATQGRGELAPVDLPAVLRSELAALEAAYAAVETDLTAPDDVEVVADDLLGRVFANLFTNAVENHDGGRPRVDVTVVQDGNEVEIRVADDGPGVPADVRDSLFERGPGDHGLGLYLVSVLTARYGGAVELTETGPDGSVFTVTLHAAADGSVSTASEAAIDTSVPLWADDRPTAQRGPRPPD